MIGGFILRGGENTKVVTRALGPSLAKLRVANVIQNPSLELHDQSGTLIGSNNDWRESQDRQSLHRNWHRLMIAKPR